MFRIGSRSVPGFYSSPEWKRLREVALLRSGYRCALCSRSVAAKFAARVDHIRPVRECPARALDITNLQVLCTLCDAAKHADKGQREIPRQEIGLDGYPKTGV